MGQFVWVELATTDSEAAGRFYQRLFGWESKSEDLPGGQVYHQLSLPGKGGVGGLYQLGDDVQKQGFPPNWLSYVSVADADAAVVQARALGGHVTTEAFDVMDAGRMALLQDPTGAPFAVWQAGRHKGATAPSGTPGTFAWHELSTTDVAAAGRFYTGLFGWTAHAEDSGTMRYTSLSHRGESLAGMLQMGAQFKGVPSHWLVHFLVRRLGDAVETVRQAGGRILSPPVEVAGVGRFAVAQDPQGATFGLISAQ